MPAESKKSTPPAETRKSAQWLLVCVFVAAAALIVLLYKIERHYGLGLLFKY